MTDQEYDLIKKKIKYAIDKADKQLIELNTKLNLASNEIKRYYKNMTSMTKTKKST